MRLIFVDTETNDHPSQRTALRIVSMTWLVARLDGVIEKRQNYLVKPEGFRIAPGATRIHGITEDQARREGRPIGEVLGQWVSDLRAPGDKTLVGHHIQFDIGVIAAELNRHHFDLAIAGLPTICTMRGGAPVCRLPKARGNGYKNPKLQELHLTLFGQPFADAHTSQADVEATARCFFELRRRGLFPDLGATPATRPDRNPSPAQPEPMHKTIVPCPRCQRRLRVPASRWLDITCPICRQRFRQFTGDARTE